MDKKKKISKFVLVLIVVTHIVFFVPSVVKTSLNIGIKNKYGIGYKIVYSKLSSMAELEKERWENKGSYVVTSGYNCWFVANKKDKIIFQIWDYSTVPSTDIEDYSTGVDEKKLEIAKKIISKLNNKTDYYYLNYLSENPSYYSFDFYCVNRFDILLGKIGEDSQKRVTGRIGKDFRNLDLY